MRDMIFFPAFAFCLLLIFKRPLVGVCMWVWTALLFPNFLLWGFASGIRYNLVISVMTLGVILIKELKLGRLNNRVFIVSLFFLLWTFLSSVFSVGNPEFVSIELEKFVKVFMLFTAVLLVARTKEDLLAVMASVLLGLGYYVMAEGTKVVLSGGGHRVWGPATSIIGDNNHFALAVLITLPFSIFLYRNAPFNKVFRLGILAFGLISVAAVFGTYSRGGLIGLIVFSIFYSVIFKKKALMGSVMLVVALTFTAFVPKEWADRMDTIKSADEDGSFMGRVIAWKQSTLVAMDHPFVGGGFKVIEHFPAWLHYSTKFHKLDFVPTGFPSQERPHAAHSIYFQVLGEHGFIGLCLFLLVVWMAISNARRSRKIATSISFEDAKWHKECADCLLISLAVYMVVGAALNMAYFDLLYLLFAMTQVQMNMLRLHKEKPNGRKLG